MSWSITTQNVEKRRDSLKYKYIVCVIVQLINYFQILWLFLQTLRDVYMQMVDIIHVHTCN